jgi:HAD superfamily hydrolase (TIGR01509 family)
VTALEAVVFDFDGLIIDSEWVIFESALAAFAAHGHELTLDAWAAVVGTNERDERAQWEQLCTACGVVVPFAREDFEAAYDAQDRSNRDTLPLLAGVLELARTLRDDGVRLAIASSSSRSWLDRHVGRLAIDALFPVLVGADMVGGRGKPAPDVYVRACADLGADPRRSVALEDSQHGIAAARAAGMATVAVPGRVTRSHDFSGADLVVTSLTEVTPATLAGLVPVASR